MNMLQIISFLFPGAQMKEKKKRETKFQKRISSATFHELLYVKIWNMKIFPKFSIKKNEEQVENETILNVKSSLNYSKSSNLLPTKLSDFFTNSADL